MFLYFIFDLGDINLPQMEIDYEKTQFQHGGDFWVVNEGKQGQALSFRNNNKLSRDKRVRRVAGVSGDFITL